MTELEQIFSRIYALEKTIRLRRRISKEDPNLVMSDVFMDILNHIPLIHSLQSSQATGKNSSRLVCHQCEYQLSNRQLEVYEAQILPMVGESEVFCSHRCLENYYYLDEDD